MEKVLHSPSSGYQSLHLLSKKECEVLVFSAMGLNSKEISIKLDVLPKSIDNYKNRITKKLGVKGYGALGPFVIENRAALLELGIFLFPQLVGNLGNPNEVLKIRNLPFQEMENISGGGNLGVQYYPRLLI